MTPPIGELTSFKDDGEVSEDEDTLRLRRGGVGAEYDHSDASSLSSDTLVEVEGCEGIGWRCI